MKKTRIIAIFTIFILGALSITFIYNNLWGLNIYTKNYKLFVYMNDSFNLSLGTPVLMNGVNIGKVQDIYLESDNVVIVLQIDEKVKVPIGSEVKISYKGLIGDLLINIFRSTNKDSYKEGDKIKGEAPISPNIILEKMTKIAGKLEIIAEDISKIRIGKLIKNIERFSININKTYTEIEKILQNFKKDNYTKIGNTISNIENSTEKISKLFSKNFYFYPEIELITTEFSKDKLELDGSLGIQMGKIYAKKRGLKDWQQGYTFKLFKDLGFILFSAGIIENSLGAGIEIIPIKLLNIGIDAYNFTSFNDFEEWKLDMFGRVDVKDLRFKVKYGLKTKQLSMGLGYKF